ncbi:MAG: GDP-mannose 4,6-dehydratase [Pirellulaceae bacterium]|nr:MAG: GDP-mannose 4,6-dehydratase [Pirellulaceae bacterium]
MKRAIITGVSGQDGSYLAELLLSHDYEVHGIVRKQHYPSRPWFDNLVRQAKLAGQRLFLHQITLHDTTALQRLLSQVCPHEVYHLAGQSHVGLSFDIPESTCDFTGMGTLRLLEIVRSCSPPPRFLHASSSEIFGIPAQVPQDETTPHHPVSPYGAAKSLATNLVRIYRESYGLFACNAICFNHESPRRGTSFVTRKITQAAARIKLGLESELALGDLDAQRDWGYAPDFVSGFHRLLQHHEPMDCIFATGQLHRVQDWLDIAFNHLDLDWRNYVVFDPRFARKAEPTLLVGRPTRAQQVLHWTPSLSFDAMVIRMVEHDLQWQRMRRAA